MSMTETEWETLHVDSNRAKARRAGAYRTGHEPDPAEAALEDERRAQQRRTETTMNASITAPPKNDLVDAVNASSASPAEVAVERELNRRVQIIREIAATVDVAPGSLLAGESFALSKPTEELRQNLNAKFSAVLRDRWAWENERSKIDAGEDTLEKSEAQHAHGYAELALFKREIDVTDLALRDYVPAVNAEREQYVERVKRAVLDAETMINRMFNAIARASAVNNHQCLANGVTSISSSNGIMQDAMNRAGQNTLAGRLQTQRSELEKKRANLHRRFHPAKAV